MKTALVILAEGFEEIEAVTTIDILRRADVQCVVAAHGDNKFVTGKTGIQVIADELLDETATRAFDLLVLPGGPGVRHLRKDPAVIELTRKQSAAGRLVGAICAGPTILNEAGLLSGCRYTAHPSVENELSEILDNEPVVLDGNTVTSRGAGTAVEFALRLVGCLEGEEKADQIRQQICA